MPVDMFIAVYSMSLPDIPNVLIKFGISDRFLNVGDIVTKLRK